MYRVVLESEFITKIFNKISEKLGKRVETEGIVTAQQSKDKVEQCKY